MLVEELTKLLSEYDAATAPKPPNDIRMNMMEVDKMLERLTKDVDRALHSSIDAVFENVCPWRIDTNSSTVSSYGPLMDDGGLKV